MPLVFRKLRACSGTANRGSQEIEGTLAPEASSSASMALTGETFLAFPARTTRLLYFEFLPRSRILYGAPCLGKGSNLSREFSRALYRVVTSLHFRREILGFLENGIRLLRIFFYRGELGKSLITGFTR